MVTGLNDPVNYHGTITTINELDKLGLITYKMVENFHTKRGVFTKYFADIKNDNPDIMSGYEIGKFAYLSKTGQKIEI